MTIKNHQAGLSSLDAQALDLMDMICNLSAILNFPSSILDPRSSFFNKFQPAQEKQDGRRDPESLQHVDFGGAGLVEPKKGHRQNQGSYQAPAPAELPAEIPIEEKNR